MTDMAHMNEILDNICIPRVVGTPGHTDVKNYIKKSMKDLGWEVESDPFDEKTPNFGILHFENIVATHNPNARRYLALACHYDSKYTREGSFIGATDSAVPCAQLINLAKVMKQQLDKIKKQDVSLMFIFFDGEEAFQSWGPKDSIYGARHLAKKWYMTRSKHSRENDVRELDKMDMLLLLDLIGAPDPTFYNYFENTQRWYNVLVDAENTLARLRKLEDYSYGKPQQRYFQPYSIQAHIEDDHIPFMRRNVPILHLIPYPFPPFWHESGDNRSNIDLVTTENINRIIRVFVASYLRIDI
ncbi:glutaminyl-peptide cyclotransferase isoform X2 [Cephus cinctus]|nr:glutaminyl-peptide cyclotransferase isoform X2 [Cephus cinctus]